MEITERYVATGNLGRTFCAFDADGNTYLQIEFPDGSTGSISSFDDYSDWNFSRWNATYDIEELDEFPDHIDLCS